jgi:hypothetical protein
MAASTKGGVVVASATIAEILDEQEQATSELEDLLAKRGAEVLEKAKQPGYTFYTREESDALYQAWKDRLCIGTTVSYQQNCDKT